MARVAKEEPAPRRTRRKVEEPEAPTHGRRSSKAQPAEEVKMTRAEKRAAREAAEAESEKPVRGSSRRAKEPAEEVVVSHRSSRRKAQEPEEEGKAYFNPLANLDDAIDEIEKHVGIAEASLDPTEKRMSTGLLMQDVVLGGGLTAGWYTNFGQEQTCKTTDALSVMASSLAYENLQRAYFDYEGSGEAGYIENIVSRMSRGKFGVKDIFGIRDEKSGQWLVKPKIRYRPENIAEKFFDWFAALLRKLPDKKKIGDQWYYIYQSKNKEGKEDKATKALVGNHYDEKYFKKTGMYRIPAPDGSLQAIILLDSYPAMQPEVQDVDDPNEALAAQARMFSTQLRRVKGRMKAKRVAVLGINILREVPMAMYGPSEKEACGTALKQFSDVRIKHTSRALSGVPYLPQAMKKGMILEEKSVTIEGGSDHYRYIHIRADKNKLSRPYMEAWLRLWITDGNKEAQGFDPVWDTYCYLMQTGQASGKMSAISITFEKQKTERALGWYDFKRLILGDRKTMKAVCEKAGLRPFDLREACFKQMASGKGIELFNKYLIASSKAKTDEPAEEDDE